MAITNWLKKAGSFFTSSKAKKSEDGRDQWPSRTAFLLASVGGAVGQGNIIRYPSQVFNNIGLQWFIPYLIAIFLLAIPGLILEVSIGQAYRGGTVVAFNNINRRTRGTGLASIFVSSVVVVYFAIILVWIMIYFRHSFTSPLPWEGRTEEFYYQQVLRQVDPIPGVIENGSSVGPPSLGSASGSACTVVSSTTGRAVYFTMGLPIIFTIILIGRCTSLENAGRGIKLYFATWNGDQLSNPDIWQTACGQVFFSTGVGFGYYIAYASFNAKYANAVQDAIILVCSNCFFETVAAFAVFGVVGYLDINPSNTERLGSFEIGFLTYPAALVEMPGANFWAVLFFLTLMLLGISSTYPMLDVIATGIMDRFGHKVSKPYISTGLVISAFLISLMYCTRFGYYLLDGVDRWINNLALVFVVWAEMSLSTTVYRYTDILGQTGKPAYFLWNFGYFGGQILGVAVGHGVSAPAGAGAGFGCFVVFTGAALLVAKTPDAEAPGLFNRNAFFKRFWFLAFYSGNQLRRDLNVIVAAGKNWNIPALWGPLLRYISSPILFIVYSFAYPEFWTLRNDPVYVFGFILAHICLVAMVVSVIAPRFFDVFVPVDRRDDGVREYAPNVTEGLLDAEAIERSESGSGDEKRSSSENAKAEKPL
ncbi:SNF-domain-containing protein [Hortaea werneckii]|nr:SNF-domain-containing protein [Hortaea werneckii]